MSLYSSLVIINIILIVLVGIFLLSNRSILNVKPDVEQIVVPGNEDERYFMPYSLAVKVHQGKTVYLSGINAAPLYHSHPHIASEFDEIPLDAEKQTEIVLEGMIKILSASGGDLSNIVQITIHVVDVAKNGDKVQNVTGRYFGDHTPASTVVEVPAIITDPRLVVEITAVAVVSD